MGWLGKIAGGGIGFFLGGPLGAVLGAAIGHGVVDSEDHGEDRDRAVPGVSLDPAERKQAVFFTAAFAMLGKMAKADGRVTEAEIRVVDDFMRNNLGLDARARRLAADIFNRAKTDPGPFSDYARQFGAAFADEPQVRQTFFELLLALASADGKLHPTEERLLLEAVDLLGLPDAFRQRVRTGGPGATDLTQAYRILGLEPTAGDDEVKRAYRKVVRDFHPDTIASKGLPEEFTRFAEEKFKEIQAAYEAIRNQRNLR